jgi:hypothetical protein
MFGYVASPGLTVSSISDMIAAAMNINVTVVGAGGRDLERLTID